MKDFKYALSIYSKLRLLSIGYLLGHIGLGEVVKDKCNLFLDILWRLHNPFSLVSCHEEGINVGSVYRGLQ